jgi:CTP:molybdopterin cytidylyltransferase MocA
VDGLSASLRAGLSAAEGTDADAVVDTLVDLPAVGAGVVRRLGPLGARQVATVGERQRPGEVELDESE